MEESMFYGTIAALGVFIILRAWFAIAFPDDHDDIDWDDATDTPHRNENRVDNDGDDDWRL